MSTLHITNGDCAAVLLRQFVSGPVVTTCDPLYEGPVNDARADLWDIELYDEVVLWFEHDLYDQLLIIRTLDLLVRLPVPRPGEGKPDATYVTDARPRVSMICIDRFPGVEPFYGLGQLTAEQLATLFPARRMVTTEQYALATAAWDAFRNADPTALCELTVEGTARHEGEARPALPFLGDALARFLAEYPSVANGLTRTEELALRRLEAGPLQAGALFAATQSHEPSPFMGDWGFFDTLRRIAFARVPLITIEGDARRQDLRPNLVSITNAGRAVIGGTRDAIALNGIDLWRGGVHLAGRDRSPWRWDASRETLVSCSE